MKKLILPILFFLTISAWSGGQTTDDPIDLGTDPNGNNTDPTDQCDNPTSYYQDLDGDGFGNPNITIQSCTQPTSSSPRIHVILHVLCQGLDDLRD